MQSSLTTGRVSLQLLKLSLPMVWGILSVLAFSLADTYFIAQLGTNELAAISFTFPVVSILASVAMGLGTGAASVIAREIGKGNRRNVQRLTTDSLLLSFLIVGILAALGLITIRPLFTALGARPDLLPMIHDYMGIWYLGMAFLVIPLVGNSAIRASGNTVVPSLIMAFAALVNIVADPLLIFGWGPLPALGIKGAALATVCSRAGTLVASLTFLHFRERLLTFTAPSLATLAKNWHRLLFIGVPAAATNLISPLSVGLITGLMARYGTEAVAGFGLASKIEAIALIVPIAISASIGPFVGQNWGAQKYGRIKQALRLSVSFCLGWGAIVGILLGMLSFQIITWFDSNPDVISSASVYLTLVPISYGALSIVLTVGSASNALGKPFPAMAMSLCRLLLLYVPLAYLGSQLFGIIGIFSAACVSNAIVGLGAWLWQSRWMSALTGTTESGKFSALPEAAAQQ
ncbi:MAG: MATE family efflux transporter [Cyanobacteria bacterium P01_B01_bin.77]